MMNKLTIISLILVLAGCTGEPPTSQNASESKVCLDGVSYYLYNRTAGNAGYGYLAPVFNKDTKQVELCNE